MTSDELFTFLLDEAEQPFSGWDFSHITGTGRLTMAPLPWGYASKVISHLGEVKTLLDMGTGGGEFLSRLRPLPEHTCATEGYPPNVPIARAKLEPLGVKVDEVTCEINLPYFDGEFELIINRHESYSPTEVRRILKEEGWFITQQAGGENDLGLNRWLGATADFGMLHWNAAFAARELTEVGLKVIESKEDFPISRFYDVGAVVFYLKAIPWQIPDFTVEKYKEGLKKIHKEIQERGFVEIKSHRFMVVARKL